MSEDYENALWSNSFYSLPAVISLLLSINHITTLQRAANIPTSALLQLVAELGAPMADRARLLKKTSLMAPSPSMRALESILNSPEKPRANTIVEEDEDEIPLASAPEACRALVLTFHTAKLAESVERRVSVAESTEPRSSVSTIAEATPQGTPKAAAQDETPKLGPPVALHELHLPCLATFLDKEVGSGATKVSSRDLDHDTDQTLRERADVPKVGAVPPGQRVTLPLATPKVAPKSPLPVRSMLDVSPDKASPPKESSAFATPRSQALSPAFTPKLREQRLESPKTPRSPPRAPRSSTMGDLVGMAKSPSASKRFSFRGLFKLKLRNHSLAKLAEEEPSKPAKLAAKSFSTPNLSAFSPQKSPKEPRKDFRRSIFGKKKLALSATKLPAMEEEPRDARHSVDAKRSDAESSARRSTEAKTSAGRSFDAINEHTVEAELPEKASPEKTLPECPLPKTPKTPATASSAASSGAPAGAETPSTAYLNPESNTIREVDDSDYLPKFYSDMPEVEDEFRNESPDVLQRELDPAADAPQRHSNNVYGEELSLEPELLRLDPSDSMGGAFGLPFAVAYPESTPRVQQLPRKLSSQRINEQLAGEALFPKTLNALEVDSIVSLERSRSMRSIKLGKRSSYINYSGSDENVILGGDVVLRQGSMKRLGSILKHSLLQKSLRADVVPLIDGVFDSTMDTHDTEDTLDGTFAGAEDAAEPHDFLGAFESEPLDAAFIEPLDTAFDLPTETLEVENFSEFIEFTDYIDVDNLDFGSPVFSPIPSVTVDDVSELPASAEAPAVDSFAPVGSFSGHIVAPVEQPYIEPVDSVSPYMETVEHAEEHADEYVPEAQPLLVESSDDRAATPEVIVVSSTLAPATPATPERSPARMAHTPELTRSPLNNAYDIALNEARASPSTAARPISMSFKGFNGSAFANQNLKQSGSHQLVHMSADSLNELLAVGAGFGSDLDDTDDDFSEPEQEPLRVLPIPPKQSNAARRQQHAKNTLGLQPPPLLLVPFHHDRIPSLSDHSATSSPRLLTLFILRIRKLPMALPRPVFNARVKFSSRIILYDTYNGDEYDRHPDVATCNQLTPALAQQIKDELNEFKASMLIHEESQCYTHFF